LQDTHLSLSAQLATVQAAVPQSAGDLNSAQLQALPISGRNWQNFVLDSPPSESPVEAEGRISSKRSGSSNEITVDGSPIRLAFGGAGVGRTSGRGASLIGPGASEAAIRNVQVEAVNMAPYATRAAAGWTNLETQRGTNPLHGQAFLFDRQNAWGALNPFTQWVRETQPASLASVPTFTPQPYTPNDLEWTWGVGLGGAIRRNRVFWFASFDSHQRNDAGVSTVKHPDNFFAQPSNDQMQVLSARLGLSSANPVAAGVSAYSKLLETLAGLLGPAARTTSQWSGFGRIDWKLGDRQSLVFEGTDAHLSSPGGGFTRASENYGSHSFGSIGANEQWFMGRWQAFLTPNLLVISQGSVARHIQNARPQTPSTYEQSLNINAWGQLPQIVVDSRYGFTIGNPARFGSGSYPDENLYHAREQASWAHGPLLFNAGFELTTQMQPAGCAIRQAPTITRASGILHPMRLPSPHLG
jgi:hypothetical protein